MLLVIASSLDHLEADVLQTRSLRHLPVYPSASGRRHGSEVNNEVANLTEEVVLVGVPVVPGVVVWIGVDNGDTLERSRCLDSRDVDSIADKLGVVQLNEGCADEVGARWEVHNRRSDGRGVTTLATAITGGDCVVDGSSIIFVAVAYSLSQHVSLQAITCCSTATFQTHQQHQSLSHFGKPGNRYCHQTVPFLDVEYWPTNSRKLNRQTA